MNISNNRNSSKNDGKITFPKLECWNPMTHVATIAAQVSDRRVLCRISMAVLQDKFSASEEEPMVAVNENRVVLETAAKALIEKKAFEQDGNIIIRGRDI